MLAAAAAFAAALTVSACGVGTDSANTTGLTPSGTPAQTNESAAAPAVPSSADPPAADAHVPSAGTGPADAPDRQGATTGNADTPESTAGSTERSLTFIATGDDGLSGPRIGCGDSAVSVPITTTTIAPLGEVMRAQLAEKDIHLGQSGLYNALAQSNLTYDSATIADGHATVRLSGQLLSGGVCDIPRITEQLTAPALQFDNIDTVTVLINGEPLEELLDLH